jgi:tetratricopeptide (TPR) repeat protein
VTSRDEPPRLNPPIGFGRPTATIHRENELHLLSASVVPVLEPPLPDALAITRALRPLKRRVPSRRPDDIILDEVRTAERAVEGLPWWPETIPRTVPWLDLTLVVDTTPSMAIWRSRVTAFITLLEQLGAFRRVSVRLLDAATTPDGSPPQPVLRGGTSSTPVRNPAELLDPPGRRIILVVTDGMATFWRQDLLGPILARWGRVSPVSVINVLPQWQWARSGLTVETARLAVPVALAANSRWAYELRDTWLHPDPVTALPISAVPIPILELRPAWLASWAHLIAARHPTPIESRILLTADTPRSAIGGGEHAVASVSADEAVRHFRSTASPAAFRLATLLAAVPVSLSIAEFVRVHLVPGAGPEHVAEIISSGLLYARDPKADQVSTSDTQLFEFPEAARALLLGGGRRSEAARTVKLVAARFGDDVPMVARLWHAITDPHGAPDPTHPSEAAYQRILMQALSGPYKSRADRLTILVSSESIQTPNESVSLVSNTAPADRRDEPVDTPAVAHQTTDLPRHAEADTDTGGAAPSDLSTRAGATRLPTLDPRQRQAGEVPPVWGTIPPRNPNFTGRDDLLELLGQRLTAGGTTAVLPATLHGMGGIGKTQMAVEYIYRNLRKYDIIWWIQAATPTQIRQDLTDLAHYLRLPGSNEANTAVPNVREALRLGNPYRRWLLVFDAAESPDIVHKFFPTNGPGEIIITSRNPDWAGVARPLEVSVFKREESKELLRRRGPDISDEDADRLAEKLGDLPLAIEQAAAWRAETGMPVGEYLRLFDEKTAEILETSTPPDYELSVAAAWNVSFDALKERSPAAHQILRICAFFAPEPISRDLFTGVRGVTIAEELDQALADPMQLARAIRDINRYGLAKIDHGNNTIQLHRLVQLVLRHREKQPQLQAQMLHGAHQLLANLDPNDPENSRHWPRYRELQPHASAADVVTCDDAWVRQLAVNLMRYLFQWGDHEEAHRLAQHAYDHFLATLGPNNLQTLDVATRLGSYRRAIGLFTEAAELNRQTLELRTKASGENSEEALNAQLNVVIDLRFQGDFAASRALSDEVYQKSKKLFGPDDPVTLNAAYQHALSLRISGEYRAAAELDEETHRRRSEVLGFDHPQTLSTLSAMIVDRREAGDYSGAHRAQERHSQNVEDRFGEDSPDTWTNSFYLAVAERKQGDHTGALRLSGPAFKQFRIRYGENHPTTLASALAHSIDLRHAGDLNAARELGEDTFERYRDRMGEHHPHTHAANIDLALTLRLSGDPAGARALDERSFEHLRTVIGPDHPYAIVAGINLASDLAALGEFDAAVALDAEVVERAERVLGAGHPTTLAAALNRGLDLRSVGRAQEAESQYTDALARYRKVMGEAHPGTVAATKSVRSDCDIDPMLM